MEENSGYEELSMKRKEKNIHRHITSFQIIILGFLGVILTGSFLLMLPWATQNGNGANFKDALFTATSAVCVTGLVVHDTVTYWSTFGQAVILLLIQIGGMGVVTVAIAITAFSGRKIGLMQRSTMQEAIAAPKVGGIVRMTFFILKGTFVIECLGAFMLSTVFIKDYGLVKGIWYSIFHSISAFCNAGFDLMGVQGWYSSLTGYASCPVVNITIMLLIVTGGIGFMTWEDIKCHHIHWDKYRMQSKVIFTMTTGLIVLPALYFFFMEFKGEPMQLRILSSLFQAVTPRTAGFNTMNLARMSDTGKMITILLMLIGGAPGSTAGGMKVTTIAVLGALAFSSFRQRTTTHLYNRCVCDETLKNASTILLMYIGLFMCGGMVISSMEHIDLLDALFETGSAIGTVGLTLGITPGLGEVSRMILIGLMFFGRVGGLTLIYATLSGKRVESKYPQEKITVG